MQSVQETAQYEQAMQILADLISIAATRAPANPKYRPLLDAWKDRRQGLRVGDVQAVQDVLARDGEQLATLISSSR
ncbi:hypothetical protein [Nocardia sp. XZ_19_231]|uniref:hypothetical protein n=1 Tax=Nocardia sp. XZ_19_231 TaxID=2769252 RepID=UPI00188DD05F|nr:hypothetical protein [Nocardia sp. XZ_19_231]